MVMMVVEKEVDMTMIKRLGMGGLILGGDGR